MKRFQSDFILLNKYHSSNNNRPIDEIISELEVHRTDMKDIIRMHSLRIREDSENHSLYGLEVEHYITKLLSEANLSRQTNSNFNKSNIYE